MANDLATEIEKIDRRIQRLRDQRAMLLKLQRNGGATTKRVGIRMPKETKVELQAHANGAAPTKKPWGFLQKAVSDYLKSEGRPGSTASEVFHALAAETGSPETSIRTTLYSLQRKGLARLSNGLWTAARG